MVLVEQKTESSARPARGSPVGRDDMLPMRNHNGGSFGVFTEADRWLGHINDKLLMGSF